MNASLLRNRMSSAGTFLKEYIEYLLVKGIFAFLRKLSPECSSNLGGWVGRFLGPKLPVSKIAHQNLQLVMPELSEHKRNKIIRGMWDNLGRNIGEFPHLSKLKENTPIGPGWEVVGAQYLTEQEKHGGAVIFVSGHLGNWEMLPMGVARYGVPFSSFYRAANNKRVNKLILDLRAEAMGCSIPMFPKGAKGARQALKHLIQGGRLGVLSDQKMNDGIEVPFFGKPAMTSSAVASLALRLECPVIPGYVERLGPARLRIIVEPPIKYSLNRNNNESITILTGIINNKIEGWIRKKPEIWLWIHKRWPKN